MNDVHARQRLILGDLQDHLASAHVAVVGASGTGSPCVVQLAHLGVGAITIVDDEPIDKTNLNRILGATPKDAEDEALKVDVVARLVAPLSARVTKHAVEATPTNMDDLLHDADLVISCVDNHTTRWHLNNWTRSNGIPFIDMGCKAVRTKHHVNLYCDIRVCISNGPCLNCMDALDPERLAFEALSKKEQDARVRERYADEPVVEASVMPMTTATASLAVNAAMHILVGLDLPMPPQVVVNLTTAEITVPKIRPCRACQTSNQQHGATT